MKKMRVLGKTIEKYAKEQQVSLEVLGNAIGGDINQVRLMMAGRLMVPYSVIERIASVLRVDVLDLVHGDEVYYKDTVVSCMEDFSKDDNREMILDIVYDCLDVIDAAQE